MLAIKHTLITLHTLHFYLPNCSNENIFISIFYLIFVASWISLPVCRLEILYLCIHISAYIYTFVHKYICVQTA